MSEQYAGLSLGVDVSQVDNAAKSLANFAKANEEAAKGLGKFVDEEQVAKNKAKEFAGALKEQKKQFEGVESAIDPTYRKMKQLSEASKQLDSLWQKGMIPDDKFFTLSGMIETQTNALNRSKKALTEEGRAALDEAKAKDKAASEGQRFLKSLQEQANAATMTKQQMLELRAAQLGVSEQAAPLIQAATKQGNAMKLAGISAGQYQNALRMLPAQITDVATSLASGMPIWLVAVQQGGQIKDSFGGIGNTFKALLGYLTPVRLALGGVVGVIGTLGVAAYQAEKAQRDLSAALVLTGGYAATSTGEITAMAQEIAKTSQATTSTIVGIATTLAKSGRYTSAQIKEISGVTADWAEVTGDSADKIIGEFDKISKDPVQGLKQLNETYNFLEKGQLTYINNIKKTQGETAAVTAATKLFADVMENRIAKLADSATPLEKMWTDIKKWSDDAWKWVGDHTVGALSLITDVVAGTVEQVKMILNTGDQLIGEFVISATKSLQNIPGMGQVGQGVIQDQQKIVDEAKKQNAELAKSIAERNKRVEQGEMGYIRAREKARKDAENNGGYSSKTKDAVEKEGEALKKNNQTKKESVSIGDRMVQQYEQDVVALQAQLKVLQEHQTINDKISQQHKELFETQAKIQVLEKMAADDGARKLTADEKTLLNNKEKILALAQQKAEIGDQIVDQERLNKLQDESVKFIQKMGAQTDALNKAKALSSREAKRQSDLENITANYINSGGNKDDKMLADRIAAQKKFYAEEDAVRSDWLAGGERALADYGDAATNMYDNMGQVATSALNGMSDMMVDFLMTGKANFTDFAKSIISMILKMITQMVIFNTISGMMGGGTYSFAGGMSGKANGGVVGGTFAGGGYTGSGGKYQPAGIVHKGEFVMTKEATRRIGIANLYRLMRGYASGGAVGGTNGVTQISGSGGGFSLAIGSIPISISNGGDPASMEKGIRSIVTEMLTKSCTQGGEVYNYVQTKMGG